MTTRPFYDFLREHRNGRTHDDLAGALNELTAAVVEENKSGSLTITIKIKPAGNSGALEVAVDHKIKAPVSPPGVSIFFPTPENNLVRTDPKQMTMELREIAPASPHRGIA